MIRERVVHHFHHRVPDSTPVGEQIVADIFQHLLHRWEVSLARQEGRWEERFRQQRELKEQGRV